MSALGRGERSDHPLPVAVAEEANVGLGKDGAAPEHREEKLGSLRIFFSFVFPLFYCRGISRKAHRLFMAGEVILMKIKCSKKRRRNPFLCHLLYHQQQST
jgi:hypothetical protein